MEDIQQIYEDLWKNSRPQIQQGNVDLDPHVNRENDARRGITLRLRFSNPLLEKIDHFLIQAASFEPDQYCNPLSDMHITALSLVTCRDGFSANEIHLPDYIALIQQCLVDMVPFQIKFQGITASPSCIMLQGFPQETHLNDLRDRLRKAFSQSHLQHTIDKRYPLRIAHSTVVRFCQELQNPSSFLEFLDRYRHENWGTLDVETIELVFNDWYHKEKNLSVLHTFPL